MPVILMADFAFYHGEHEMPWAVYRKLYHVQQVGEASARRRATAAAVGAVGPGGGAGGIDWVGIKLGRKGRIEDKAPTDYTLQLKQIKQSPN